MIVVNLAEELLHVGRRGGLVKKTPEEIGDGNARTNEVGLLNYADSYLCCAKHLNTSPSLHLRFDAPIHFLLFHAAELKLRRGVRCCVWGVYS